MRPILPTVVIAGAPKCGTTSVFEWLSAHPEVCVSSVKETYYFMDEGYPLFNQEANYHRHGLTKYYEYFKHCAQRRAKVILEATPDYLYQKTAPAVLSTFRPRPKIIFVLRKPSTRIFSFVRFSQNNEARLDHRQPVSEIVKTIMAQPEAVKDVQVSMAVEHSRYVNYLETWINLFGAQNIHVYLFEHLIKEPMTFMQLVSSALHIDGSFYRHHKFYKKNETYEVKSQGLHRLKLKYAGLLPPILRSTMFKGLYYLFNTRKPQPVSQEDREVMKLLDEEFSPYNESLAKLLKIDLSVWK